MNKTQNESLKIDRSDKGDCFCCDLENIKKALIVGKAGSGKSYFLHSAIERLSKNYSENEMKLSLFDGKMVEFWNYKNKKNLTANSPINELTIAIGELEFIISEMNARLEEIANGRKNDFYKIVIIIDELGEFCFDENFMDKLKSIIQSGYAVGIYTLIAIQNIGMVDDEFIKMFPTRICFGVCDESESIKVLGETGAEKLKLPGEYFYKENGSEEIKYINNYKNNMQGENMMNNNNLGERYPFNVINCIFGTHDCFPKDEETAEKLIGNQDFWTDYEKALDTLDAECKDVVVKHFKEGKTLNEIASEEKVSCEVIDARCAKALRQLRHPNRANFLKKYIYRGIPMINFDISSLTAIQEEKIVKGIEKYMAIKKLFDSGISLNDITNAATFEFQKLFNSFYRVRRNEKWRKVFYDLFDDLKANKSVQFDAAFNEFTQRLQACNMNSAEKSFVSKMVHTINNNSPIIDGNVLKGLHIKGNDAVKIYSDLRGIYTNELLPNAEAKEFFADFDKKFPNGADMSKVKKIDFYLWALFAKRYSQSKIIVVY